MSVTPQPPAPSPIIKLLIFKFSQICGGWEGGYNLKTTLSISFSVVKYSNI